MILWCKLYSHIVRDSNRAYPPCFFCCFILQETTRKQETTAPKSLKSTTPYAFVPRHHFSDLIHNLVKALLRANLMWHKSNPGAYPDAYPDAYLRGSNTMVLCIRSWNSGDSLLSSLTCIGSENMYHLYYCHLRYLAFRSIICRFWLLLTLSFTRLFILSFSTSGTSFSLYFKCAALYSSWMISLPRLDVMMMMVFLKLTNWVCFATSSTDTIRKSFVFQGSFMSC